ncbi:MAG: hypothetical protein VW443_04760 [Pseudomonadales bacterium]|jgi:hypothetical protein
MELVNVQCTLPSSYDHMVAIFRDDNPVRVGFVLVRRGRHEWVTWRLDENGNPFSGNYFNDEDRARKDFGDRVSDYLTRLEN